MSVIKRGCCLEFQAVKHSYGLTQNSKQKERPQAVEVVWFNYDKL